MELWIRSQDKETLVKANALYVMDNQIWNEVPFYENHKKIGLTITGHNHKLAQYKSKERALEVLDEIQNILLLKDMYKYERELVLKGWENADGEQVQSVRQLMSVYKMPKE